MQTKYEALIPLRGNSKSIPLKNIKLLCGKPLFYWSTQAALKSNVFERVCISTDSPLIKAEVLRMFPDEQRIEVVDRAAGLALDETSTEAVMFDYLEKSKHDSDVLCLVQATSPLVTAQDFIQAKHKFEDEKLDSLFTATLSKRFFWSLDCKPQNYDFMNRPRRQEFEGCLQENGAFYFSTTKGIKENKNRLFGKIGCQVLAEETSTEIDEPADWTLCEAILNQRLVAEQKEVYRKSFSKIKGVIFDVDGTMTDAGFYYGKDGEALKKFNTRDAHGLSCIRKAGIKVGVITAESSPSVHQRMKKLDISDYHHGIKNKIPVYEGLLKKWNMSPSDVAYMGDDLGDMDCLKASGFSAAPGDAVFKIKEVVQLVTLARAGQGAVREFCDLLLETKEGEGL